MKFLIILLLILSCGTVSATDYYVSTTGNNGGSGDIDHPWMNVSHAIQQVSAGDSINLFDGTWYNEDCDVICSGTAIDPIIITAHNGTPKFIATEYNHICVDLNGYSHYEISDLYFEGYGRGVQNYPGSYINIVNCTMHSCEYGVYLSGTNYSIIDRCTVTHAGWTSIQISAEGVPQNNVTISNCFINDSQDHGHLDLNVHYGMQDINIIGNTLKYAGTDTLGAREKAYGYWNISRMNFSDNVLINYPGNPSGMGINNMGMTDSIFHNNSFYGYHSYGARLLGYNITASDNYYDNDINCTDYRMEIANSYYETPHGIVTSAYDDFYKYDQRGGVSEMTDPSLTRNLFRVQPFRYGFLRMNYTDGYIFTSSEPTGHAYTMSDIEYFPDGSMFTLESLALSGNVYYITRYNITLKPVSSAVHSVVVNHESIPIDDRISVTMTSNVSTNPTWINATMQDAGQVYNVSVGGVYTTQRVSGADKVVRYRHTITPSPITIEFATTNEWVPSDTESYYNFADPILITTYLNGTNHFDRTPTQYDSIADTRVVIS